MKGKKLAIDLLISIPITFVFLIFIYKLIEILTRQQKQDTQKQDTQSQIKKTLIYAFIFGIIGLALGYYVFGKSKLKNRPVEFGLCTGSLILLFHSLITNWDKLQHDIRLLFIGVVLCVIIFVSYFINQ